eukprot:TRINITY_DN1388_c0_g1_i3.p1 TRINITY_DN1388_c0_g1~~TRINITY_DN1388_c0_g1_i3.p1  ORF type:complete len:514 (+),score=197.70 TRINITY_DN1388_c0_g1_i3:2819-4360(+)
MSFNESEAFELQGLNLRFESLVENLKIITGERDHLKNEIAHLKEVHSQQVLDKDEELKTVVSELKEDLKTKNEQILDLSGKNSVCLEKIADFERQNQEYQAMRKTRAQLEARMNHAEEEANNLQNQLDQVLPELEETRKKHRASSLELQQANQTIKEQTSSLERITRTTDELKGKTSNQLNEEREKHQKELQDERLKCKANSDFRVQRVKEELSELFDTTSKELNDKILFLKEENDRLVKEKNDVDTRLEEKMKFAASMMLRLDAIQNENAAMKEKYEEEIQGLRKDRTIMRSALMKERRSFNAYKAKIMGLSKEINQYDIILGDAERSLGATPVKKANFKRRASMPMETPAAKRARLEAFDEEKEPDMGFSFISLSEKKLIIQNQSSEIVPLKDWCLKLVVEQPEVELETEEEKKTDNAEENKETQEKKDTLDIPSVLVLPETMKLEPDAELTVVLNKENPEENELVWSIDESVLTLNAVVSLWCGQKKVASVLSNAGKCSPIKDDNRCTIM